MTSQRPSRSSWVSPGGAALPAPSLARRLAPTRPTRRSRLSRQTRSRPSASAISKRSPDEWNLSLLLKVGRADGAACRSMATVGSSGSDALLGAVAVTLLVVLYGRWLYRSRRLRGWPERLRFLVALLCESIAGGGRAK